MAQAQDISLVFMGTPRFAAIVLEALAGFSGCRIAACYTQPDRPSGRGMKVKPSPVKSAAKALGLEVRQPATLKADAEVARLADLRADILVVAAYGLILPPAALAACRIAPVNVHASLLPRYRGAAPIARAIMENWGPEAMTGVSLMRMEAGLDIGPVYAVAPLAIAGRDAGELTEALARAGADLLLRSLPGIYDGTLAPRAQDAAEATYAPKISREDCLIDWALPLPRVDAWLRALTPEPGARTRMALRGASEPILVRIESGHMAEANPLSHLPPPGSIVTLGRDLAIACGDGLYSIDSLRPAGRKAMSGADFLRGYAPLRALCPKEQTAMGQG